MHLKLIYSPAFVLALLLIYSSNSKAYPPHAAPASGRDSLVVPNASRCQTIITDGQIEEAEWNDARKMTIHADPAISLLVKQNADYVFLAVRAPFKMIPYVDIYFDLGEGSLLNVHSSSQIGERTLKDTSWNDMEPAFHFGNNKDWYANEQRFDRIKAQELLKENPNRDRNAMQWETTFPYEGFEYIFKKSRFHQKLWKMRVEVKTGMPGYQNVIYPAGSELKNSAHWSVLKFE